MGKKFFVSELREITLFDKNRIKALIKRARQGGEYSPTVREFFNYYKNPRANTFVARDATGKIIGFAQAEKGTRYGRSWATFVHPDWRKLGIGKALLRAKIHWLVANKRPIITTYVNPAGAKLVKSTTFFGQRFRQVPPDQLTARNTTKFVLDLREVALKKMRRH